jgi:hypothetical protein
MKKSDYTKEKGGSATEGLEKYRMPIMRDTDRAPHYKMRMQDKSSMERRQRQTKRT